MSTKDIVSSALLEPLQSLGFRKRAGGIFTVELTDDVLGWLGLNRATRHRRPGDVEVNPVIGVRHRLVEAAVARLSGEKGHAYLPVTVSTPIGYVMPDGRYTSWVFSPDAAAEPAADLATAVERHALPFMRARADLPALLEAIDEGLGHNLQYRRPVVLHLMGRSREARASVQSWLGELGDRDDVAADHFRTFAATFLEEASPR